MLHSHLLLLLYYYPYYTNKKRQTAIHIRLSIAPGSTHPKLADYLEILMHNIYFIPPECLKRAQNGKHASVSVRCHGNDENTATARSNLKVNK